MSVLKRPYHLLFVPDEDGDVVARVLEFPGCITHGSTVSEAYTTLEDVAAMWVSECLKSGQVVPEPFDTKLLWIDFLVDFLERTACLDGGIGRSDLPVRAKDRSRLTGTD
jgi:predicted RNase H-like HicB family nuclease